MTTATQRLEVDHKGWAMQYADKPKWIILQELIQNGLDEQGVTRIDVIVVHEDHGVHRIIVQDDAPDGYHDIRHAWTLFAPSKKGSNPDLRGIFNVGCKMVAAMAIEARVTSTKAAVEFTKDGGRKLVRKRTQQGTVFNGTFRMSIGEAIEAVAGARRLIVPSHIALWINDERVKPRKALAVTEETLPTRLTDPDGNFRTTRRKTDVGIYEPHKHEDPMLYEMGIPVVELDGGFPWHINVKQRVPLNADRDNVTPAYLTKLRVAVLNATSALLDSEQVTDTWVQDASGSPEAAPEAVEDVLTKRYGEKRVAYDPSDPEGSKLAMSKGYTVVHGASLTKGQWSNARRDSSLRPAGQVTPSPRAEIREAGGITPVAPVDRKQIWDEVEDFASALWHRIGHPDHKHKVLTVQWYKHRRLDWAACWGTGALLYFNAARMGAWELAWQVGNKRGIVELLVHEFAHEVSGDHLSSRYHRELCRMAGELAYLDVNAF
jgi:hypothetical protein